ncbi:DOMON-like domain-containing protein [Sphingopyxis indica]|nr:DOMON-like domain-containing protein [Sphingopyxis indica]
MDSVRKELICHPDTPADAVQAVWVEVSFSLGDGFALRFGVEGDVARVVLPPGEGALVIADAPTDGLWQTTCFEAFLTEEGEADYTEFNYAPDGRWACYQFDDYRSLARTDELAPWEMTSERGEGLYILRVEPGILPDRGSKLALAAVIEEIGGTRSYWALRHPPGKPDFHHRDCFALTLGAPPAA